MKLKPNVELKKDLLSKLVKYYRYDSEKFDYEKFEDWECFSRPSLELHICNSRANLPGNRECGECHGNPDVPCQIGCYFQNFCLAVFAYRLGIGGEDFDKALNRNLYKKTPDQLYNEVTIVLSCGLEALPPEKESLEDLIKNAIEGKAEPVDRVEKDEVPENLITLYKASQRINISYSALKAASEKDYFKFYDLNGKRYVSEEAVDAYNQSKHRRKRVKK